MTKCMIFLKSKRVLTSVIVLLNLVVLSSCQTIDKTPTQEEDDYMQGYDEGYAAAIAELSQNQVVENDTGEQIFHIESSSNEEDIAPQTPSETNSGNSILASNQPDIQIPNQSDEGDEVATAEPDIVTIISSMQASAPVIDTKTITVYDDEGWASDMIFMPGEHIGEYNGIQVDEMLSLSSLAYQEKYYVVTDDLKNVENTLRNAYGKTWLELGYTNCIPAIRYDSRQNRYEENPYDMVHPGWSHSYAVMYSCVWSDGNPRYGLYYIRVANNTNQEVMAILCPIESVSDGINIW